MPTHVIIKLLKAKDKENILKAAREKQHFTYRGRAIQTTVAFSSENMEVGTRFFKCQEKTTVNTESHTLQKHTLRKNGEMKTLL